MNSNQFKIFIPDTRFGFTTNRIMYTLLAIMSLATYLTIETSEIPSLLLGLTIFVILILFITSFFRKQKLQGELSGILELRNDSIIIDNKIIPIDDIEQIDFNLSDFIGRREHISRYDLNLNPRISSGVKNYCEIKTTEGKLQRVYFQIEHDSDFQQNRKTLIQYHNENKLTFKRLSQILYANSYIEIQELKNEIGVINQITSP